MDKELIRQAIADVIMDEIVSRVSEKLMQLQKKALVVCTGSVLGFDEWMESLRQLQEAGFSFDLFMSYGAMNVLDVEKIKQNISFGSVWQSNLDKAPEVMAAGYPTIIVPALTVATASRIAQCTADTAASRMILNSMMRGKNVIIATDGCCPDNPKRKELGYHLTVPLQEKLRGNLTALQDFGAILTTAERMTHKVMHVIGGSTVKESASAAACVLQETPENNQKKQCVEISRMVIGRADIAALVPGTTLRIAPESQMTQLARDMVQMKGIKIVQERN
ncbi:MAG: flavoprotein [Hespellia sp.]|nr:flavoprotein [Hespellia sp.]